MTVPTLSHFSKIGLNRMNEIIKLTEHYNQVVVMKNVCSCRVTNHSPTQNTKLLKVVFCVAEIFNLFKDFLKECISMCEEVG